MSANEDDKRTKWQNVGEEIVRSLIAGAEKSLTSPLKSVERKTSKQSTVLSLEGASDQLSHLTITLLNDGQDWGPAEATDSDDLNPRHYVDPESRVDPDDAVIKLTTAADVARAIEYSQIQGEIVQKVWDVRMTTRWTKLDAIRAIAALDVASSWKCIWCFACDADYAVRRAASDALQADATRAYRALENHVMR